jgi:uncharacterized protein (TIGR00369 family)
MSAASEDAPLGFSPWPALPGFVQINGPLYQRTESGVYQLGFRVEARHCNPMQICHGGMMATFCDMLLPLGVHALSAGVRGRFLPTVSLQIDYLSPAPLGAWVQGEAQLLRVTRTMVFAQGLVMADAVPAARVSGILKIGPPFDDLRQRTTASASP